MRGNQELGDLTRRVVNPRSRIPVDILEDFLDKKPYAIEEGKKWIEKYGLTILFTQNLAKGWESVWVEDDGTIYMDDKEHPTSFKDIEKRFIEAGIHDKFIKMGNPKRKRKRKLLQILKTVEKPI